jgi:uncharacterized protein
MTEHANAELFRRGYAAFGAGDLDTVRSLLADDVVWHNGGNNQLSGDYTGIEATIGLFLKLFEVSGGSFKLEVHDVVANDDHAVALVTASASRDDASFTARAAHVVHMRDGKLTESWFLAEDYAAADAFWG